MNESGRHSLGNELKSVFRIIVATTLVMVIAVAGVLAWSLTSNDPRSSAALRTLSAADDLHATWADQDAAVRAFLLTGSSSDHRRYEAASARVTRDLADLEAAAPADVRNELNTLRTSSMAWTSKWADVGVTRIARSQLLTRAGYLDVKKVRRFIARGEVLAKPYESAQNALLVATRSSLSISTSRNQNALLLVGVLLLLVGAGTSIVATRRSRKWHNLIVRPVRDLLASVQSVGKGEFKVTPVDTDLAELLDLSDGVADMTTSLRLQQRALSGRADQADRSAERLRRVLAFAREVSGSLTLPYVLEAVGSSGKSLTGTSRARLWLLDEEATTMVLAYDSEARPEDGLQPEIRALGTGAVGRAARYGQMAYELNERELQVNGRQTLAVPLIASGRAIGALEIALPEGSSRLDSEVLEVLEAVAGHGATAIEAARLYQRTETLSLSDALTGLANRRRLDEDLELEAERVDRYSRSMAFLMIDVDHFKRVNDSHGHAAGDRVLQQLAGLITEHMRSVDTAYRYGGEELAILARETDLAGASRLGERLREAVENKFADGPIKITVSIGIATMPTQGETSEDLLRAADDALYRAKRNGRNQVMLADGSTSRPLLRGVEDLPEQNEPPRIIRPAL